MTMAPMDSSRDGTKSVRGILSRYTPVQGVQYFRDLAGNIRQVKVSRQTLEAGDLSFICYGPLAAVVAIR